MEPALLVVNPGSSSREYGLFRGKQQLVSAYYEKEDASDLSFSVSVTVRNKTSKSKIEQVDFTATLAHFLNVCRSYGIKLDEHLHAIGVRLVAPGRRFLQHTKLDDELYAYLQKNVAQAPLHLSAQLSEVDSLRAQLPATPIYMISDSAFHHSLLHEARNYAISTIDADKFDIYRYGYHGLSVSSAVNYLRDEMNLNYRHIIVCHLGSGASVTALNDWRSCDTSMGYSPLEGLVMASRSGNIDLEAALEIKKQLRLSDEDLVEYLNKKSGLLGISGQSNDIRQLLELEQQEDYHASLALNMMLYRLRAYIGSYYASLGGLDALVFTATVGERSSVIRQRVCGPLSHLGIEIDHARNNETYSSNQIISTLGSKVAVHVVLADEPGEIAKQTAKFL